MQRVFRASGVATDRGRTAYLFRGKGVYVLRELSLITEAQEDRHMAASSEFKGFPKACEKFYVDLQHDNTREWFDTRKADFEANVMGPARDFVVEMGARLAEIAPQVVADPRLDKSIFGHYRDTRFSKDKSPHKTHLGIFSWEGDGPKMECSGFYFHLEPPEIMLGVGIHCFSKGLLSAFREAVVDEEHGVSLAEAIPEPHIR